MNTMTDHQLHHVTVRHERDADGEIVLTHLTFECRGDRTSQCHIYPACACELWNAEHDKEHPRVAHDECWLSTWFGIGLDATPYKPPSDAAGDDPDRDKQYYEHDLPERSGPITFDYDDCGLWRWADQDDVHVGRSWSGHALEDDCPCPKAVWGLVVGATVDVACPQHALEAAKMIRQQHTAVLRPGAVAVSA